MPKAKIEGFMVEDMVQRSQAFELILGMNEDPQFGPIILFGEGGTAVEVIADSTLELPPLDLKLAHQMIARTRVYRRLRGFRDQPPVNLDAVALTLLKVSQLVVDFAEIAEIDINPLLADRNGVIALDARLRLKPARGPAHQRLAIKPYPKELESEVELTDGRRYWVRPVRAEDEPALVQAFGDLSPDEIRQRFKVSSDVMSRQMTARFTQINYDREMALVVTEYLTPGKGEILGLASLAANPDGDKAEFAVIVREDFYRLGIGRILTEKLLAYAKGRGIKELAGEVLKDNTSMLNLCSDLGFELLESPKVQGVVKTRILFK
ncbi:MAG: hypothetical protein C5B49_09420 [Bdellovibrio sp.]|nr:MAG: hypothetical protein C5B49_09420 [Bdellovibrio sp.]